MAQEAGFLHLVYFYPRENAEPGDAALIAATAKKYMAPIPGVVRLETGVPAGTPRAVVDNSYAVALLVELVDSAAHDVYQDHPDHKTFIAECNHLWSRVQIYDSFID